MIMDKYVNIDLSERYKIFETHEIIYKSTKQNTDNLIKCIGVNCLGLVNKHERYYGLPELIIGKVSHGYVCSSGFIYTKDGIIYSELQFDKEFVSNKTKQDKINKTINSDKIISLLRAGDGIYGHWLVDILPIVWLSRKIKDIDEYKYVVRKNIPQFAIEFLSYFSITKDNLIIVDNQTKVNFNSAIYISNLRYDQIMHPLIKDFSFEFKNLMLATDMNLNAGRRNNIRKIYLSRGKWKRSTINKIRNLINREDVENYFFEKGFEIVYPETISLKEQVKLFSTTNILAGEDGSALHNSIFLDKGTEIICLKGKKNHSLIQGSLCSMMGQKISYIIGDTIGEESNRNSMYKIEINDLEILFRGET